MFITRQESVITRNVRLIEWLKADLVQSVGLLLKAMARGRDEA